MLFFDTFVLFLLFPAAPSNMVNVRGEESLTIICTQFKLD